MNAALGSHWENRRHCWGEEEKRQVVSYVWCQFQPKAIFGAEASRAMCQQGWRCTLFLGCVFGCHPQVAVSGGQSISAHLPLRVWVKAVNVVALCQSLRRLNDTAACYLLSQQFTAFLQFGCSLFAVCLQNVRFRASYALYLHFTCLVNMVTLKYEKKMSCSVKNWH